MSLPAFSVRQVVLVNLLFVLLIGGGLWVASRIPVDFYPDISFNAALIVTPWSGASPDEVERLVTRKLEDEIEDIVGIKEMFSFSSQGQSEIFVEWDETLSELDFEGAFNDLRAAIDRVDDLPEDAETPILSELSVSERFEVCMVVLSDVGGVGEYALREVARDLEKRLERIPGLRRVKLRGARDRELLVQVDRTRAHPFGLTLEDVHEIIALNNQNFAGGSFTDPENREVTVRGLGNFDSRDALARTVVKKNPDGSHVLLEDVAEVIAGFEKRRLYGRYEGHPSIALGVSKESDVDIIGLVDQVRAEVERYRALLPEGVEAAITWDGATYVKTRIGILRSNLLLGVFFVVLLLWLTLGFRNALLATLGVPFSFLTALVLFPLFGVTINSLSLVGFVLVSGMVVDDAIIILENIYRHIEEGEPLRQAVVRGAEEVMWPVTAAVATTVAAFIPMLTVSGTSGKFMEILPKTVVLCLLGSLLEALVVLPAHYLDFGSRKRASEGLAAAGNRARLVRASYALRARVERGMEQMRSGYLRVQARVLEQRYAFLGLSAAALVFALGLARHLPIDLFPSDFNRIVASIETPTDYGIDQTNRVVLDLEEALAPIADELTEMSAYAGLGMAADDVPVVGVNQGVLYLAFPHTMANIADPDRVLNLVKEHLGAYARAHPDRVTRLRVSPPRQGPPIGKPVAIRIQSEDYAVAKRIASEMKAELATLAGVYNVEDNLPLGPRELRIAMDENRASLHGLSFRDLGFALLAANDGSVPSTFKDPLSDEDVDIRVQLDPQQRRSISDLLEVEVRTPGGYTVKLGDVAQIELTRGYQQLYHFDARRSVVVYADVDDDQATSVTANEHMRRRFADVPERYPGVNLVFGGEFQATDDAFADMGRAFLLAVIAIYGILAAQFRSYLQPLIVMSVITLSIVGVVVGMWLMNVLLGGYAISMYVLYAIVGLAGIVVNDSLVMIDFVNREAGRGVPAEEAVRIGSSRRFRPILLTTVTTVTGLLPMALGLTGYSRVFGPFASAIVFGLLAASLLTLFVVPSIYMVLDDARRALARRRRGPAGLAGEPGHGIAAAG